MASRATSAPTITARRSICARGAVPGLASDVFTCGLMLYELLAGRHPYWSEDQAEYAKLVSAYAAKPPALAGVMPAPANNAEVSAALHRCLSPDPAARPTAAELRAILSGRERKACRPGYSVAGPASRTASRRCRGDRPPGEPLVADAVELIGPNGHACGSRFGRNWARASCVSSGLTASSGTTASACWSAVRTGDGP